MDIIKGIFEYYGKDIKTHCLRVPEVEGEGLEEVESFEDNEDLEVGENLGLNTSSGGEEEKEEGRREAPQEKLVNYIKSSFSRDNKEQKKS